MIKNFVGSIFNLIPTILQSWDTVAVATVVLALLTGALAYYTRVLARETRRTREQAQEPNIVVTIEPHNRVMFYAFLVIENVGKGPAYDIVVTEQGNHTVKNNRKEFKINDLAFMKLKVLKAGQKVEHLLGKFDDLPTQIFDFEIKGTDVSGNQVSCSNSIDVSCYYDISKFQDKNMEDFVRLFEKFERNFGHVVSGFSRLKVDTFDREEREQEQKELEERFKTQREQTTKNRKKV